MLERLQDILNYDFYRVAFVAGGAIAVLCGVFSVLIVHKRLAMIGQGISHAAFAGYGVGALLSIGLGAWATVALEAAMLATSLLAALAIGALHRRMHVSADTAIGLAMGAAMALGVLLLNVRDNYLAESGIAAPRVASFHAVLFGDILQISRGEMWLALGLTAGLLLVFVAYYRSIIFFTLDEEGAAAFGAPTGLIYYGLLIALGVTVWAAVQALGVILSGVLLVAPGAIASRLADRVDRVVWISAAVAWFGVWTGLLIAIALGDFHSGPIIAITLCALLPITRVARGGSR